MARSLRDGAYVSRYSVFDITWTLNLYDTSSKGTPALVSLPWEHFDRTTVI